MNDHPNGKPNPYVATRAILRSDLRATQARVLLAIADKAGNGYSTCMVSYGTLARMTSMSRRTVIRLAKILIQQEWITAESRRSEKYGDREPNLLRMGPRFLKAVEDQVRFEDEKRKQRSRQSVLQLLGGGDNCATRVVTTAPPGWCQPRHGGGDNCATLTSPLTFPLTTSLTSPLNSRGGTGGEEILLNGNGNGNAVAPLPTENRLETMTAPAAGAKGPWPPPCPSCGKTMETAGRSKTNPEGTHLACFRCNIQKTPAELAAMLTVKTAQAAAAIPNEDVPSVPGLEYLQRLNKGASSSDCDMATATLCNTFKPTDQRDCSKAYRQTVNRVRRGFLPPQVVIYAFKQAMDPSARNPGQVFAHTINKRLTGPIATNPQNPPMTRAREALP